MNIYHNHHIIPGHAGGTDEPSNLIRLTIEEHAEAHKKLYEEHGRWQDRLAWKSLSGIINKSEAVYLSQVEGGKTQQRLNPTHKAGVKALWAKPGMRKHLSKKRKEQSANGKNPMQGKKQRRISCICCRKEWAINSYAVHINKM